MLSRGEPTWLTSFMSVDSLESPLHIYNLALYYNVATLTSTGYGDVTAQNHWEVLLATITMFSQGFCWALVVANIVGITNKADPCGQMLRDRMDDLNTLMASRSVDHDLRLRLRTNLVQSEAVQRDHYH